MKFYKNLSLENIVSDINGITYTEEWGDVAGYEGLYMVSTFGRFKGIKFNHILRQNIIRGYCNVCLCKDNCKKTHRSHRLQAFVFIPKVEGKPYINHKNGIRDYNFILNLEWVNNSENQLHSFRVLNRVPHLALLGKVGALCKNSKKVNQYDLSGNLIREWHSMTDPQREFGYHSSCISVACRKGKTSYGYYWKIKEAV